jgi:hypothetical protein
MTLANFTLRERVHERSATYQPPTSDANPKPTLKFRRKFTTANPRANPHHDQQTNDVNTMKKTLILDNGAYEIKAGLSTSKHPTYPSPSTVPNV